MSQPAGNVLEPSWRQPVVVRPSNSSLKPACFSSSDNVAAGAAAGAVEGGVGGTVAATETNAAEMTAREEYRSHLFMTPSRKKDQQCWIRTSCWTHHSL